MWNPSFQSFGIVRVETDRVRVFKDQYNSVTVHVGQRVTQAHWDGGVLNVYLANGSVRRYLDYINFITIY